MITHENLLEIGFILLEESTRTYSNGKYTGSIVTEKISNKEFDVFCPFLDGNKFESIKLRTIDQIETYTNSIS